VKVDGGLPQLLIERLPHVDWVRIESGMTARGAPDMNGCRSGTDCWVEAKLAAGWVVKKAKAQQVAWLERRTRAGGRCIVAVRQTGAKGRDVLWLFRAGALRLLFDGSRLDQIPAEMRLGRHTGGPAVWRWNEIEAALFPEP
jgi:hypothetical protein